MGETKNPGSGRVKWVADLSGIFLLSNSGDLKPNLKKIGAFGALVKLIFDIKIFSGLRPAELSGWPT